MKAIVTFVALAIVIPLGTQHGKVRKSGRTKPNATHGIRLAHKLERGLAEPVTFDKSFWLFESDFPCAGVIYKHTDRDDCVLPVYFPDALHNQGGINLFAWPRSRQDCPMNTFYVVRYDTVYAKLCVYDLEWVEESSRRDQTERVYDLGDHTL